MFFLNTVFLLYSLIFFCDASVVDTLTENKCSIKDEKCLSNLYQIVFTQYAKPGIPEFNIPSFDPLEIKNVSVEVLDTIIVTIVDGVAKGLSGCKFESFQVSLERQLVSQEIVCNITIKGDIAVSGSSQLLQSFLGGNTINTHGKAKVKLDKIKVKYDIPVNFIKKDDGETYLKADIKQIKLTYDIEKVTFFAEKIFIGKDDISPLVVAYLNDNWKTLVKNFGQVFVTKIIEVYYTYIESFLLSVPTKVYIIEDMSSYVDN